MRKLLFFSLNGDTTEISLYKNGEEQYQYEFHINDSISEYSYTTNSFVDLIDKDTLVLSYIKLYKKDTVRLTYYNPKYDFRIYNQFQSPSQYVKKIDSYRYNEINLTNKFNWKTTYFPNTQDSSKSYMLIQHFPIDNPSIRIDSYTNLYKYKQENDLDLFSPRADSIRFFLNDQPFTGHLSFKDKGCKWKNTASKMKLRFPLEENLVKLSPVIWSFSFDGEVADLSIRSGRLKGNIVNGNKSDQWMAKSKHKKLTFNYSNGLLNGNVEMKSYKKNIAATFKNGNLDGLYISHYQNGNPNKTLHYKDGKLDGECKKYDYNGSVMGSYNYVNGELDGVFELFHDENHKDYKRCNYDLGKKEGASYEYDTSGIVLFEQFFQQDYCIGTWKHNYKNGSIKERVSYQIADSVLGNYISNRYSYYNDDEYDEVVVVENNKFLSCKYASYYGGGFYESFYPNGQLFRKGNIKNTQRVGKWEYYNESGGLLYTVDYDSTFLFKPDSNLTDSIQSFGWVTSFHTNGKIRSEGYLIGEKITDDCAMQIETEQIEFLPVSFWDIDNEQKVRNGSGTFMEYYNSGVISAIGDVENGMKNGIWREFDKDGKLCKLGQYLNNKKHGRWIEGNLEGVKYIDNACYKDEEAYLDEVAGWKDRVSITEYIYNNGELIESTEFDQYVNQEITKEDFKKKKRNRGRRIIYHSIGTPSF